MKFAFKDEEIRDICMEADIAESAYGEMVARVLRKRLADLDACDNIGGLPLGNPGPVPMQPFTYYKIDLVENLQLIIRADHAPKIPMKDKDIDWPAVTYIQIVEIK